MVTLHRKKRSFHSLILDSGLLIAHSEGTLVHFQALIWTSIQNKPWYGSGE